MADFLDRVQGLNQRPEEEEGGEVRPPQDFFTRVGGVIPTPPEPTFMEKIGATADAVGDAVGAAVDWTKEAFEPVSSVPQYEGVPELDAISGLPPRPEFGIKEALTPTMDEAAGLMKTLEAGAYQFAGAESNIPSPSESVDRIHKEYLQRQKAGDLNYLDEVIYSLRMGGPHLAIQYLADKFDQARAGILESITFEDKEKPKQKIQWGDKEITGEHPEISLRELMSDYGKGLGEEGRADLERGIPEDLPIGLSGLLAGKRSAMQMVGTGGLLGLSGFLSSGTISSAFGASTFLQVYDETLADTGDEERAFANGVFAGVVETATELPAFKALEKLGDGVMPAIAKYFAREFPTEYTAEILQFAGDYVARNPEATWKETFNTTLDAVPEIIATTTIAVGVGGSTTAGVYTGVVKSIQAYEKVQRARANKKIEELDAALLAELQASLNEAGDELVANNQNLVDLVNEIAAISEKYQAFGGDPLLGQLMFTNTLGPHNVYHEENAEHQKKMGKLQLFTGDALQSVPYVAGGMSPKDTAFATAGGYTRKIKNLQKSIAGHKQIVAELNAQGKTEEAQPYAEKIKEKEQQLVNIQKRKHISQWLGTEGRQIIEQLKQKFLPETSIIVTDGTTESSVNATKVKNIRGQMWYTNQGELILELFPMAYLDKVTLNEDGTLAELDNLQMLETLLHEFGHGLAHVWFNRLPQKVQESVYKAYDAYRQRVAEMKIDKDNYSRADLQQLSRGIQTADISAYSMQTSSAEDIKADIKAKHAGSPTSLPKGVPGSKAGSFFNYVYSFDEWFAHEMERAAFGTSDINKVAQNIMKKDAAILKAWHEQAKEIYKPTETFEKLLQLIQEASTEQRMAELRKILDPEIVIDTPAGDIAQSVNDVTASIKAINKDAGVNLPEIADPQASLDKFNGFMRNMLTLTQVARENPHISSLQRYVEFVERWWAEKSKWNERAVETVGAWQSLGKDQADRLAKFALAVTLESDNLGRRLTSEELQDLNQQRKYQLDNDAFAVWEQIDKDFTDALGFDMNNPQALYKALLNDIKRVHAGNPDAALEAITILNKEMTQMANRNFFPLSRFGRYTVTAKAKEDTFIDGVFYKKGQTISFETYEDIPLQKKAARTMRAEFDPNKVDVLPDIMDDTQFAFAGMPPNLINALKGQLGLSPDQLDSLDKIILEQTTASRYKKHLLQRANVPGFSHDAMRGYAAYMAHFSNAVARMEFAPIMQQQIQELEISMRAIKSQEGVGMNQVTKEANRRRELINYLKNHFEYVMNPGNELANLRSVAFIFYMGALPKSAFVNLSQVPMVAWPYLSARKELGGGTFSTGTKAAIEITAAMKDIGNIFKGKQHKFKQNELEMFDELVRRGILDESLAQELGAMAEGSNLQRMLPDKWGFGALKSRTASKVIRNTSYAAAYLFHNAEKFNRRVTALAAYRMAIKQGLSHEKALSEAHKAVTETQYEYARWNRPKLMRGQKSVIFMFKMYLENTLYQIARGEGGRRSLMMFMLMAGLSGLPFAEDAMDLYDLMVNFYNKHFGKKGARSAIREDIRELATGLGLDPNMIMHGLAHKYGLGPIHLLEYAGIPISNVNTSGSLSLGRVVPGLEALTAIDQPDLGRATADAAGAVVAIPIGILKALNSDSPDQWKALEYGMPNAVKYWSQASRYLARGKETRMDGSTLYDFDLSNPLDIAKIVAHGMGFQGTEISDIKARDWAIKEQAQFFRTRKAILLNQFSMAQARRDREGIADARKAVRNYNDTVPHPSLSITGKDLGRSLRQKAENREMAERGLGRTRKGIPAAREINRIYPVEEESVR